MLEHVVSVPTAGAVAVHLPLDAFRVDAVDGEGVLELGMGDAEDVQIDVAPPMDGTGGDGPDEVGLRGCLQIPRQTAGEESNPRQPDHGGGGLDESLVVLGEPPISTEPRERALDDPPAR